MIGLDTNVLVRYIMQDDPIQSPKAIRILERRLTEKKPGFLSLVTMLETFWVLQSVFGLSNRELASAIERILQIDTLVVQNEKEIHTAMMIFERGLGSFEDALTGALASWTGCGVTVTFEKKASRLPGFELIP